VIGPLDVQTAMFKPSPNLRRHSDISEVRRRTVSPIAGLVVLQVHVPCPDSPHQYLGTLGLRMCVIL
jgi:hypothetical protein